MKIYKEDSPLEKKVQQVENLMRKLDLTFECSNGIQISDDKTGAEGTIIDQEHPGHPTSIFPRFTDSERIALYT